ncbi:ABC transporter ATP-binding protein [Parathermosynechococcus lividus]|jgi:neutral amino acid transport system ATP-binding protein|uniref:ABC transporter ATP-binding protein n=1 Tax=Parathermosynechococcus lividus PCC 6715 TaxID=1917166 RepID=A0A2D2Q343_PARLV|nr:ABC transporter ATP-binding protein [Thermostichus lividus]ATS18918.1 ABC transporter ATP-binding protein [Thermostichus lividus PCC 6715]MCH9056230.1 ABC transporter ATP-binding protein [Synechococcus sp. PCC 6716]
MSLLQVCDVYAGYIPDVDILRGVNVRLEAGELIALIGPNGAGKSTLAKTIAGLLTPRRGTITLEGEDITYLRPNQVVKKGIGYVPQIANVFRSLTVEENLDMGAFITSGNITALKQRVYDTFPRLWERRQQRAGTLSGGERQMLAMGRAMMLNPRILVLDEPSAALSPALVSDVFAKIKEINAQGTAIILVEQNARKALAMSDRGYVLEMGKDRYEGLGTDLLNDPKVGELYLGITRAQA